jgi:hypothetical protein
MGRENAEVCPRGERITLFFVIPGHREAMSPESITPGDHCFDVVDQRASQFPSVGMDSLMCNCTS